MRAGRVDSLTVEAAQVVPADREHVAEHPDGVLDGVDAAAGGVRPGDGHFLDAVAQLTGNVQYLDVEAEADDPLSSEHVLGALARERLEAALRVLDAAHRQRLDEQVEDAPHQVTGVRLADAAGAG